ncbi:MAG TPA: hypothetical protein VL484_14510 [Vicinamibacterales bacterium]|jgi:hypothetical protein|nr:hypothetical protein [Vicinamibacterales bacterium]
MRIRPLPIVVCLSALLGAAAPAAAQYGAQPISNRATGETYHVEAGIYFWDPTPDLVIASEALGQIADRIDFVNDLGIEKSTFRQFRITVRPGTKHKFRFEFTPVRYEAQKTITRTFVFNGQRYTIGLPVSSEVKWNAYRFGYEWDFVYLDRGFVGLVLETKYTDVQATLNANFAGFADTEFTHAKAPIPAIGITGRGYVTSNISITGEFTGFKLPQIGSDTSANRYSGKYFDFDLYGTVNFTNNFGVDAGWRSFDVDYLAKSDSGTLKLNGFYFGGKARF